MPTYRVLAGRGTIVEEFEALNEQEANRRAMEIACECSCPHPNFPLKGAFRLERHEEGQWRLVFAWAPGNGPGPPPST